MARYERRWTEPACRVRVVCRSASLASESTAISPFNFEGKDVRVIEHDGEPWFVGSDVAKVLEYADPKQAVRDHCKARKPASELKGVVSTPLHPQTVLIPERDVYRLVMRSKLPSAEAFEEWVVAKVIPAIRKKGRYEARTYNAPSRNALHTLPQRVEDSRPASGMIVVNVERGTGGGVDCEVVDGRELYEKIGTKEEFRHWIKDRIRQLKFVENQQFERFGGISPKPGRPPVEYRLTLVMAKKIAMAEHTDAGNAVRNYFLDRERISYEAPRQDVSLLDDIDARIDAKMDRFMDRFMDRLPSMIQAIGSVQAVAAPVKIVAPAEVASVAPVAEQIAAPDIISPQKKRGHDEQNATAADSAAGWVCQHRRYRYRQGRSRLRAFM